MWLFLPVRDGVSGPVDRTGCVWFLHHTPHRALYREAAAAAAAGGAAAAATPAGKGAEATAAVAATARVFRV